MRSLFGFCLLMVTMPYVGEATTLTGAIKKSDGSAITGLLRLTLSYPSRSISTGVLITPTPISIRINSGVLLGTPTVYGNDDLEPASTFYLAEYFDTDGKKIMEKTFRIIGLAFDIGAAEPATVSERPLPFQDSGIGLRSDLAGVTPGSGSALVGYRGSGSGATARTVQDRLSDLPTSVRDYGATGDGKTDDTAFIQAALIAGGSKVVTFPPGTYKISAALTITAAGTQIICEGATIHQARTSTDVFSVSAWNVSFRRCTVTGSDTSGGDVYTDHAAFHFVGKKYLPLDGASVENCMVSQIEAGIEAPWTNLYASANRMWNLNSGIFVGTSLLEDQNRTGGLRVEIVNNHIECAFGRLEFSRPIALCYYTGSAKVDGNFLRGGGQAIEALLSTASANHSGVRITQNDMDTSLAAGYGVYVDHNIIDLDQAPSGRGMQPGITSAIEVGGMSIVSNNVVRYHTQGVTCIQPGLQLLGNRFYFMGKYSSGAGGVIYISPRPDIDTNMNVLIEGNYFHMTGTASNHEADILVQYYVGQGKVRGIIIDGNYSYGNSYVSMLLKMLDGRVSNNTIHDAANSVAGNAGIISGLATGSIEFSGNTFINTVAKPNGMDYAIATQSTDIIGTNKYVGMVSGEIKGPHLSPFLPNAAGLAWKDASGTFDNVIRNSTADAFQVIFTRKLTGNVSNGFAGSISPIATYDGGFNVGIHNNMVVEDVALTGGATVKDQAFALISGIPALHKVTVPGANVSVTIGSGPIGSTAGDPQGWICFNINGKLRYVPFW